MIKLPVTTYSKDIDIKTVNGQSVFDLREQILTIFSRDPAGLPLREFFAEPVPNEIIGEISWYTQADGPVVPLHELGPAEQSAVMQMIGRIDIYLKDAAGRLVQSAPQLGWLRDATVAMLSAPNLEGSVFRVGSVPVLTQWGCVPFGADPALYHIVVQDERRQNPRPVAATFPRKAVSATADDRGTPPSDVPLGAGEELLEPTIDTAAADMQRPAAGELLPDVPGPMAEEVSEGHRPVGGIFPLAPFLLLLLLLLLLGLYLHYLLAEQSRLAGIDASRQQVDELWGTIAQRAEQCRAEGAVRDLDLLTPQTVERDLQQNSIGIGQQLNVSLVWTAPVDLDLAVTQPDNVRIDYGRPASGNGRLDIDANRKVAGGACLIIAGRTPVENISWNRTLASGVYRIKVTLFDMCDSRHGGDVPFKLIINRKGQTGEELRGSVRLSGPVYEYVLTVP